MGIEKTSVTFRLQPAVEAMLMMYVEQRKKRFERLGLNPDLATVTHCLNTIIFQYLQGKLYAED